MSIVATPARKRERDRFRLDRRTFFFSSLPSLTPEFPMSRPKKPLVLSSLLALAAAAGLVVTSRSGPASAEDAPKTVAVIKDVMFAVNAGDEGLVGRLKADFAKEKLDDEGWEFAKGRASMIMEAGTLLLGMKPPRGEEAAWKKHVNEYRACAEQAREATLKKDSAAGQAAMRGLQKRCAECHKEHQKDE